MQNLISEKYNPLISIIVPIYNIERYVKRCIDSIVMQTYSNLEIVLVDDGSIDRCGCICDYYSGIDKRIIVIHKPNGGLSDARNKALDIITGKYVSFVDGDDCLSESFVERVLNEMLITDSDIGICDEEVFVSSSDGELRKRGSRFEQSNKMMVMSGVEALDLCLRQKYYDVSAWGKVYKSSLLKKIRYPVGMVHEDLYTTFKIFAESKRTVFINEHLYYYNIRDGSIMNSCSVTRFIDLMDSADEQEKGVKRLVPELENSLNCRTIAAYFQAFEGSIRCKDDDAKKRAWTKIKKLRGKVLLCSYARRKIRIASILSYLGPEIFAKVQMIYYRR